jgi:hypothetical protein
MGPLLARWGHRFVCPSARSCSTMGRIRVGKANYSMAARLEIVAHMENENGMIRRPRRRFSAEEKARIIGLYEASGLTGVEFCRREGVRFPRFCGLGCDKGEDSHEQE